MEHNVFKSIKVSLFKTQQEGKPKTKNKRWINKSRHSRRQGKTEQTETNKRHFLNCKGNFHRHHMQSVWCWRDTMARLLKGRDWWLAAAASGAPAQVSLMRGSEGKARTESRHRMHKRPRTMTQNLANQISFPLLLLCKQCGEVSYLVSIKRSWKEMERCNYYWKKWKILCFLHLFKLRSYSFHSQTFHCLCFKRALLLVRSIGGDIALHLALDLCEVTWACTWNKEVCCRLKIRAHRHLLQRCCKSSHPSSLGHSAKWLRGLVQKTCLRKHAWIFCSALPSHSLSLYTQ